MDFIKSLFCCHVNKNTEIVGIFYTSHTLAIKWTEIF